MKILVAKAEGKLVLPSEKTLNGAIDEFLAAGQDDWSENTRVSYRDAFKPVRERLGGKLYQDVTKADVVELKSWMLREGRRRGGQAGGPLSGRTVNYTLSRLRSLYDDLLAQQRVSINPAKMVKNAKHTKQKRGRWAGSDVACFCDHVDGHRLEAAFRLTSYACRRSEVLGLRWEDVEWGDFLKPCDAHGKCWCVPC